MTDVFNFSNYQDFLKSLVRERGEKGLTKAELARAIGIQATYLARVLKGEVHLTEDNGLRLCETLGFRDEETEHFLLILRMGRASTHGLKSYLERKRKKAADLHSEVESRVHAARTPPTEAIALYYSSSWIPSAIHLATSCKDLQTSDAIAKKLNIDVATVQEHLQKLESFHLVKQENKKWEYVGTSMHFPERSPTNIQFQTSRRLMALNSLTQQRRDSVHYSVVFATELATFQKLKHLFLDAIAECHRTVEPTESQEVCALCLDLFRI